MSRTRERSRSSALRGAGRMEGVTVTQVPRILRRSLAWIVVPTAVAALSAATYVSTVTPRYTGEAQIILDQRELADEQAVASQVRLMTSRDLAREAIHRLNLVGNPDFDATAESIGPVQQAMLLLGLAQNPLDRPAEDRAIEAYLDHLSVAPAGRSHILDIAFRAPTAQLAADGANTAAQLYIASLGGETADASRRTWTTPDATVAALRRRLAETEAKVEAYRAKHSLGSAAGTAGQPLSVQQLADLSSQLSQARIARADIAGRLAAIKELLKDGRALEVTDIAGTETLRRMLDNRITLRAQLALESRTLLPAHPRIKALKAQLDDSDAQIKLAAERAVKTLENDAKLADARVANLQAAVDGRPDTAASGNPEDGELKALEREAKTRRDQLDTALGGGHERAGRDAAGTPPAARILMRAMPPALPSFPEKLPIVGFVTLAALLLAIGGVLIRAVLTDPRRTVTAQSLKETTSDEAPVEAALAANPFLLPEALPPDFSAESTIQMDAIEMGAFSVSEPAEPASSPEDEVPAPPSPFDLVPLTSRLSQRSSLGVNRAGRTILVVDGGMSATGELFTALAGTLVRFGSVVTVDFGAPVAEDDKAGFTDIISGLADFADVIQPDGPGGAHRVAAGLAEAETLFEEPRALAFTMEAMAEAYAWVVCRLHHGPDAADLLALISTICDSVVIASDADPADPALTDLYAIATDAGAGQVLIAQDRPARAEDAIAYRPMRLLAA